MIRIFEAPRRFEIFGKFFFIYLFSSLKIANLIPRRPIWRRSWTRDSLPPSTRFWTLSKIAKKEWDRKNHRDLTAQNLERIFFNLRKPQIFIQIRVIGGNGKVKKQKVKVNVKKRRKKFKKSRQNSKKIVLIFYCQNYKETILIFSFKLTRIESPLRLIFV